MTPVRHFDLANRLTQVTDWAQRQTAYTYDPIHRQTGIDYPNAATAAFAWNAASRLTGLAHSTNSETFIDRAYTLDLHGNITAMTVNAGLLPQIAPQVKRLRQNPADELTSIQTKANPGVQDWSTTNPDHDLEGNLVSDGTYTYGYDFENRLVLCDSASLRETYFYVADGSRVAAETVAGGTTNLTIFVLDHGDPLRRPLAELDAQGQPVRYFVWGNGLVAQIEAGSGAIRYFHADGQGSTLALTDENAGVTDQWFHDPYGETLNRTGTTATPYQWIGGHGVRHEPTGLHFMQHRYYHAGLKRFTATDPLGVQGLLGRGGLANLYQYANNSPLMYIDPDGRIPVPIISGGIGAGVGAVIGGVGAYWKTGDWRMAAAGAAGGAASGFMVGSGAAIVGGALSAGTIGSAGAIGSMSLVGASGAVVGNTVEQVAGHQLHGHSFATSLANVDLHEQAISGIIGGGSGAIAGGTIVFGHALHNATQRGAYNLSQHGMRVREELIRQGADEATIRTAVNATVQGARASALTSGLYQLGNNINQSILIPAAQESITRSDSFRDAASRMFKPAY